MGSLVGWEGEEWRSTPDIREGEVTVEEVAPPCTTPTTGRLLHHLLPS